MLNRTSFFQPACRPVSATHGFLPADRPVAALPPVSPFNIRLNQLAEALPELGKTKKFRETVNALNDKFATNVVSLEKATTAEREAASRLLTMFAQMYVWEDLQVPSARLPAVIAKSLYQVTQAEQRHPTLCYADYILHNWRLTDPEAGFTPENIEPLLTLTGTTDETWFIKIHVAIEATAGAALSAAAAATRLASGMLVDGQPYLCNADHEKELMRLCKQIQTAMKATSEVMLRMKEHCAPDYFWNTLRLYLNGWEKVIAAESKEAGVRFDGLETKDPLPLFCLRGASGAQSSVIPALDAALGVKHEDERLSRMMLDFKTYMPMADQLFISQMSQSKVDQVVKLSSSQEMQAAWKAAIDGIKVFRMSHMGLVNQYLHQEAAKSGIKREDIVGTGGTSIDAYLGSRYRTTMTMSRAGK